MSRLIPLLSRLLLLSLLVVAVGCQDPNKDAVAQDEAQAAADRIRELQGLYDEADRARIAAEDEAHRLRAQRDQLQAELAGRPEPTPGPQWESIRGGVMTSIEGTVLFDSGKEVLKTTGKQTLDQVARVIREKYPDYDIYVFGHADNEQIRKSGWKDNYELSCQRALSVVRYLKSKGLPQSPAACGWGQYRPVSDNTSASGRRSNRRVEIFALAPDGTEKPVAGTASARP